MWKNWFGTKRDKKPSPGYDKLDPARLPRHVAIIMDGNGRWAQKRGMPRTFGHRAGAETLREIVKTASEIGLEVLTAYAFSTENWKRPADEVGMLMNLFSDYLDNEIEELHANGVRLQFIGDTAGLAKSLQVKVAQAEARTAANTGLTLNLAVNYGGRSELVRAIRQIGTAITKGELAPDQIDETIVGRYLYTAGQPDPDLLIRPSGDLRLSNFLLWQSAYAEFWFTDLPWPDFKPEDLIAAVTDYQRRERRFGGIRK